MKRRNRHRWDAEIKRLRTNLSEAGAQRVIDKQAIAVLNNKLLAAEGRILKLKGALTWRQLNEVGKNEYTDEWHDKLAVAEERVRVLSAAVEDLRAHLLQIALELET